jgi:hypothetical protein
MCLPMAALAVPLLLGSAAVGLYGASQQASAERDVGKANQQIAENNARLARGSRSSRHGKPGRCWQPSVRVRQVRTWTAN